MNFFGNQLNISSTNTIENVEMREFGDNNETNNERDKNMYISEEDSQNFDSNLNDSEMYLIESNSGSSGNFENEDQTDKFHMMVFSI